MGGGESLPVAMTRYRVFNLVVFCILRLDSRKNFNETPKNPEDRNMEAEGVEPSSRGRLMPASTCVGHILLSCLPSLVT